MAKIQIKRGLQAGVEGLTLDPGELAVATDTGKVYVGTDEGVTPVGSGGGEVPLDNYYTKGEINALMGDAGSALDEVNGEIIPEHVADKLAYLSETKQQIRDAIASKGVGVSVGDTFRTYAEKVGLITAGGGGGTLDPLNPVQVYNATRPTDWLKMPEPQDDEMYLLLHIPDGYSSLIAFTVACTGSYVVELGTVADGVFVADATKTQTRSSEVAYQNELFSAGFGGLTSDGMKQCMVKISGTEILTWEPKMHSKKSNPANFSGWNIVEISCRLPNATKIACGSPLVSTSLKLLRYFSMTGGNNLDNISNMFYACSALKAVLQIDTGTATKMYGMFHSCSALVAIPPLDTANVTSMYGMFYSCSALSAIPPLDTANVTSMGSMFYGCSVLSAIPPLDTANVTEMGHMFYSCPSLTTVPLLNTARVTNMGAMFYSCSALVAIPKLNIISLIGLENTFTGCYSLASLRLVAIPNWPTPKNVNLAGCSLSYRAIVDLFNEMPYGLTTTTITLTGNPGVSELTASDKAIVTNKKWKLIL